MRLLALLTISYSAFLSARVGGETFEALSARATAARQANDIGQAVELYRQAVRLNPKWEEGWWFLGSLLYDGDQYPRARDALRHFVELNSKAAPAWGILGLCEFETGEYADSLAHIERSLSLGGASEPQMGKVLLYHEALLLTRTGEFDRALQKYAEIVRNGGKGPSIFLSAGLAALRTPLLPKDVPEDQQALFATAGKAVFETVSGNLEEAQQTYHDLLTRHPTARNVHYLYGCFLLSVDPQTSMDHLKLELKLAPDNDAANAMVAFALLERGDAAGALPYAQKAAEERPGIELAQYVFGRSLTEKGQVNEGIEHLELAEKIEPANVQPHISLATAYSKAGRPADARRERLQSLALAQHKGAVAQP